MNSDIEENINKMKDLLKIWSEYEDKGIFIVNPQNQKIINDEKRINTIFAKYFANNYPSEYLKNEEIYKETLSYFYGRVLYKWITGSEFSGILSDIEIKKVGLYQFLKATLASDFKERNSYPNDLLKYLNMYGSDETEEDNKYGIKIEAFSTVGFVRTENQDNYGYYIKNKDEMMFIIADGMGGGEDGDKASEICVNISINRFKETALKVENVKDFLKDTIMKVNEIVLNYKEQNKIKQIGSTISIAVLLEGKLYVGHVGDSRIYIIRDGEVNKITYDQSQVATLLRKGEINREEKKNYPSNILLKSIGQDDLKREDIFTLESRGLYNYINIKKEDEIFLCSDGVWEQFLGEEDIKMNFDEIKDRIYNQIPNDNATFLKVKFKNNYKKNDISKVRGKLKTTKNNLAQKEKELEAKEKKIDELNQKRDEIKEKLEMKLEKKENKMIEYEDELKKEVKKKKINNLVLLILILSVVVFHFVNYGNRSSNIAYTVNNLKIDDNGNLTWESQDEINNYYIFKTERKDINDLILPVANVDNNSYSDVKEGYYYWIMPYNSDFYLDRLSNALLVDKKEKVNKSTISTYYEGEGNIELFPSKDKYDENKEMKVKLVAGEDWEFKEWEIDNLLDFEKQYETIKIRVDSDLGISDKFVGNKNDDNK
ncbi:protein phosphatase 2C domain-containing protein [Natroniella acetigena]|uniref:protein phosphatase 2C domain-containing protein n=1 Tax=Natroniella acetigena TaxID=52004 RepID=UPI00200A7416|nr:protein phosphatase 2C domain-containing protein [Natroniella acetigena]MCK8827045.1 protein phosphatase 2C domain-containing protein [Natroniella acetigena]